MAHRNAPLTPTGRLRLARCVVEDGWPLRRAAERFQVAPTTAKRWADRYREHGAAGMSDHSSRPHHSPRRLPHAPSGASWDYGCGSGSARPASPPGWV
jgi:transposase-like protein